MSDLGKFPDAFLITMLYCFNKDACFMFMQSIETSEQ